MSIMITVLPNIVKLLSGMVNNPVTQVADVAVKNRSINGMCVNRDIGNERSIVPAMMSTKNENRMICDGDKLIGVFLVIYLYLFLYKTTRVWNKNIFYSKLIVYSFYYDNALSNRKSLSVYLV